MAKHKFVQAKASQDEADRLCKDEAGEEIIITQRGKVVARLLPPASDTP